MTSDSRFEPKITPAERLMLTVEQSAELLGLGRTTTYELVMSGTIESVHVGRRRLIPRSALDRFIERLMEAQSSDCRS
jgi:excisionase family DNA binding protein